MSTVVRLARQRRSLISAFTSSNHHHMRRQTNLLSPSATDSVTITVRSNPPANASISINGNAAYTASANVAMTLDAIGASHMRFKNGSEAWGSYEPYATSKSWTLLNTQGTRTVSVQFKDLLGNTASAVSDSITFDDVPPGTPALTSPDNELWTSDTTPTFTWSAVSGASKYQIQVDDSSSFENPEYEKIVSSPTATAMVQGRHPMLGYPRSCSGL